jgi:hypothetical protein
LVYFPVALFWFTLGNKNGNIMTTSAMDSILQELKTHFSDKPITKDKIKDHMKHIKTKFNVCYDIFKNGLSGFAWDETKHMWNAEEEVWEKLIEVLLTLIGVILLNLHVKNFYAMLCIIYFNVGKT